MNLRTNEALPRSYQTIDNHKTSRNLRVVFVFLRRDAALLRLYFGSHNIFPVGSSLLTGALCDFKKLSPIHIRLHSLVSLSLNFGLWSQHFMESLRKQG